MTVVYVHDQGARLRKNQQQLLVTRGGETLQVIPLGQVAQVVVMGRGVQLSTALLVDLMQRGIPVLLTDQRGTRLYAELTAGPSRFAALRSQQMAFVHDPPRALELARSIVQAKLTNQRTLLASTGWAAATVASTQITAALTSLATAPTLDMVRGQEGAAAAAYFGAWRVSLPAQWQFPGRAFYPPPDPVNAMLSFGYTLALHAVLTAVHTTGLDPYLGTFHTPDVGRPALALDLLEEFRPILVDRLVLELVLHQRITPQQFTHPPQHPDAVYLNAAGRALLVEAYERTIQQTATLPGGEQTTLRHVILLQVQQAARVIRGEQPHYTGFLPG